MAAQQAAKNNGIHQNVLQKDYAVTVLTAFGQRVGMASSNLFDRSELERIVDLASAVALRQKEDPLWTSLSGAMSYEAPEDGYDDATIDAPPTEKADKVESLIAPARASDIQESAAMAAGRAPAPPSPTNGAGARLFADALRSAAQQLSV